VEVCGALTYAWTSVAARVVCGGGASHSFLDFATARDIRYHAVVAKDDALLLVQCAFATAGRTSVPTRCYIHNSKAFATRWRIERRTT